MERIGTMMMMSGLIQLVVFLGWVAALALGSILAIRGRKNWATVMLVTGVGLKVVSIVGLFATIFIMTSRMSSAMVSRSTVPSRDLSEIVAIGSAIGLGLGFLLFAAGFVGFCARYGAA